MSIERFNTIFLDVIHKDLYSAWEYMFAESLEDFKNDIGEITHAIKTNTLIRVPTILLYQIQRVKYDKDTGFFFYILSKILFFNKIFFFLNLKKKKIIIFFLKFLRTS